MNQVKPLLQQLDEKCKELGIPMVATFWTGLIDGNAQIAGVGSPNREEVEDMFVHMASICLGTTPQEAQISIDSINQIGARFYTAKQDGGYHMYEPVLVGKITGGEAANTANLNEG